MKLYEIELPESLTPILQNLVDVFLDLYFCKRFIKIKRFSQFYRINMQNISYYQENLNNNFIIAIKRRIFLMLSIFYKKYLRSG